MRRRKRNPFVKVGILCLALVLGLGGMGIGYAMWSDTLTIGGTVGTGEWGTSETGYAWGDGYAHCFEEYGFNNWGWSNGELGPGSYEFEIHAGVGQCIPTEETLVGWLTVDYDGEEAIVEYNMYAGFTMTATHLYVGTDPLPTKKNGTYTTAPGQYPYGHGLDDATTDSYEVTGLSEPVWVVAHAVVFGLFD